MKAAKAGEASDRRGVPIYPGDLLRSPHFRERVRGRLVQRWLYHVACENDDGTLQLVPTAWLNPTHLRMGGSCPVWPRTVADAEVIHGYGPGEILDFRDRQRVAKAGPNQRGQAVA